MDKQNLDLFQLSYRSCSKTSIGEVLQSMQSFWSGREKNRLVGRCQIMKSVVYYAKDLIAAWKFIS